MLLPKGAYAWDGATLKHGSRSIAPPQLTQVVWAMQDIFPELNVTGWTVVHSPDGNLHEPVIDHHRRSRASSDVVQVVNAVWYILVYGTAALLLLGDADWRLALPIAAWFGLYAWCRCERLLRRRGGRQLR